MDVGNRHTERRHPHLRQAACDRHQQQRDKLQCDEHRGSGGDEDHRDLAVVGKQDGETRQRREREAEAWKSYKMFKDDSPTVAEIFRQEWNQTYRIINNLKAAKR